MGENRHPAASPLPATPIAADTSVDFLIAEYSALREEILKRTELQHQLILAALVAVGTFLSVGLETNSVLIMLLYPILALFLATAWEQNNIRVQELYTWSHNRDHMRRKDLLAY